MAKIAVLGYGTVGSGVVEILDANAESISKKAGQPIELTQVEFQIMELFFRNPGIALVREKILKGVWGENYFGDVKIVDVNIRRLRMERGLTVRELQSYFGFEEPRAIYKWQKGESLPTVDNLYALGVLFEVPIDQILVPVIKLHIVSEQQAESCCSHHFLPGYFGYGKRPMQLLPFAPSALPAA